MLLAAALIPVFLWAQGERDTAVRAATSRPSFATPSTAIVLEGRVLTRDGLPAPNAMVTSNGGGRAASDEQGWFRLELELEPGTRSVELNAFHGAGADLTSAKAVVALDASIPPAAPELRLSSGCPPSWLPTFDVLPGVSGPDQYTDGLAAMAVFDDGLGGGPELYVGGWFERAGGIYRPYLARWNGQRWDGVGGGVDSSVGTLQVFDDGGGPALYVGGAFTMAGGQPANCIAKWDGTNWTALGSGMGGITSAKVHAIAIFDDGLGGGEALYAGGYFTTAGGAPANSIARWNGASWSPLAGGVGLWVEDLVVFDDGGGPRLYAGGHFTSPANRVARWDGTSWSSLGTGLGTGFDTVSCLGVFDDGSGSALYAGGNFTTAGGTTVNHIAKWTGTTWSALGSGLTNSVLPAQSTGVTSLFVHDDGAGGGPALYVGGNFNQSGSTPLRSIARWDGASWSAIGGGFAPINGSALVTAMTVFDDGSGSYLYAGGDFPTVDGLNAYGLARWSGTQWSLPGQGLNDEVWSLEVFDDGSGAGAALYVGGKFEHVGGQRIGAIARWDGASWTALGSGLSSSGQLSVTAMAVHDAGDGSALYVTGGFTSAGGAPAAGIARWDGLSWATVGNWVNGGGRALAVFDDGTGSALYAGGSFALPGGQTERIVKLDGATWSPLGAGTNDLVLALAVFDDGSGPALYAGGDFTQAGGLPASHIARWDGASWSPLAGGTDGSVLSLAVFDDGGGPALFVGGSFVEAGGLTVRRIARWDGQGWSELAGGVMGHPAKAAVRALMVFDDGSGPALHVGGDFGQAGALPCASLARWDGASWAAVGRAVINDSRVRRVLALASFDAHCGPELYVGGGFTVARDSFDAYLARWQGCADIDAPALTVPTSIGVVDPLSTPLGEAVFFSVTASDDCDPAPSVVCTPPSGSTFPPGVTTVHCTATDTSGNVGHAEFSVFVDRRIRER